VRLTLQVRLHEALPIYHKLREGLSTVVPLHKLYLYTWQQVEKLICGEADWSVDTLQQHTQYEDWSRDDRIIKWFWEVLKEMTPTQRCQFLRFTWGRSKLPLG